jgi:hypothetical protein
MSKEGMPIEPFDPKPAIRRNVESARDWEFRDEAEYLYNMANLFKDRFLDPILHTDRGRLPDPVISFSDKRNAKVLASYTLHRNGQGLLDEITFNAAHYRKVDEKPVWVWGRWAQLETLLHEQVHLWQENFGEHKHKPGRVAHDKEFVAKCRSLGLYPTPVVGSHYQVADGLFEQLMKELGIPRPSDIPKADNPRADWFRPDKGRGRSTLSKWTCGCQNVRVGTKEFHARCTHEECGNVFVQVDNKVYIIYKAK